MGTRKPRWLGVFALMVIGMAAMLPHAFAEWPKGAQQNPPRAGSSDRGGAPTATSDADDTLPTVIRVAVFPHIFKYNQPQREEKIYNEVTLVSLTSEVCKAFHAPDSLALRPFNPAPTEKPIASGHTLKFNLSDLTQPLRIQCGGGARVVREKGQRSFRYAGEFLIHPDQDLAANGQPRRFLRVVNIVPMEVYLKGVVPSEMPVTWPEPALRAQAIAARTYAYYELLKARKEFPARSYDVDDTVYYQAYMGLEENMPQSNAAVDATQGSLMHVKGEVIKAYFHANSGGHTDDAFNVWGIALPYAIGKPEAYEPELDPSAAWTVTLTPEQVGKGLKAEGFLADADAAIVADVKVLDDDRNRSGRAQIVRLILKDGREIKVFGCDFGYSQRLRSTLFSVKRIESEAGARFVFSGRGFGHGVGMAQVGAKILASAKGWKEDQILHFYYTDVELTAPSAAPRLRHQSQPAPEIQSEPFEPRLPAQQNPGQLQLMRF